MTQSTPIIPILRYTVFTLLIFLIPSQASAYTKYTINDDETYCGSCHGDFRDNNYISAVDGENWGDIHDLHRSTMLSGDCNACHIAGDYFPVYMDSSVGGSGLDPIGCMGCHGRDEDNVPGNPSYPFGAGAGLRQHHTNTGVDDCLACHDDASPSNYTPVGESVLPPYYADPGNSHPAMPTVPCNDDGSENFAGLSIGLDNDGDGLYDAVDPECNLSGLPDGVLPVAMLSQNHPNPFNPSTTIEYMVSSPGQVRLQVFSMSGKLVTTLVDAQHDVADTYQAVWNGHDDQGRPLPSGVFFYRLASSRGSEMKKMILLK